MGPFRPPLPVVMGHRGASREAPENTLEAFAAAARQGASWVELDVRRSSDGVAMVVHDPVLADGSLVAERTAADLRARGVIDLATALAHVPEGVGIDVEIKNLPGQPDYDPDNRLVDLVAEAVTAAPERSLLVTSFDPEVVSAAVAALPAVPAGWLYGGDLAAVAVAAVAGECGAVVVCPHRDANLTPAAVEQLHDSGYAVLVWDVDDPVRATQLSSAGVDALCTDVPGEILAALGRA